MKTDRNFCIRCGREWIIEWPKVCTVTGRASVKCKDCGFEIGTGLDGETRIWWKEKRWVASWDVVPEGTLLVMNGEEI